MCEPPVARSTQGLRWIINTDRGVLPELDARRAGRTFPCPTRGELRRVGDGECPVANGDPGARMPGACGADRAAGPGHRCGPLRAGTRTGAVAPRTAG